MFKRWKTTSITWGCWLPKVHTIGWKRCSSVRMLLFFYHGVFLIFEMTARYCLFGVYMLMLLALIMNDVMILIFSCSRVGASRSALADGVQRK
jgi:hypothetical protein